jgi:dTDP-4-amino-4,6-dideoxygalactose transaminase
MIALRALVPSSNVARRVLMPSFTFAATINAVLWAGLEPVFVDVEPESFHLDPDCLERALAADPRQVAAVFAASTFGTPPRPGHRERWRSAAERAGVPLLVDSAAGFGATDARGERLGRNGDAEVFSFHATKPFAIGEGGLVTTTDPDRAERLVRLANFGFDRGVIDRDIGINAKLAEWPAATALAVLDGYDRVLGARRERARRMLAALAEFGYRGQEGADGATFQFVPVLAPTTAVRDRAMRSAAAQEIELRSYFSVPLHRMPAFKSVASAAPLKDTEALAARVLSLPMANDLSEDAVEAIVRCLISAARFSRQGAVAEAVPRPASP